MKFEFLHETVDRYCDNCGRVLNEDEIELCEGCEFDKNDKYE